MEPIFYNIPSDLRHFHPDFFQYRRGRVQRKPSIPRKRILQGQCTLWIVGVVWSILFTLWFDVYRLQTVVFIIALVQISIKLVLVTASGTSELQPR